jgi:RIO-like serine/threonine protein kinase
LTAHNWTTAIEQKLRDALDAIHGLGIIHGDVRLENIIIGEGGNVWFIDFETALLADSIVSDETREEMIQWDRDALTGCFRSVRPQEV